VFALALIALRFDRRAAVCGGIALLALALAAPLQIAFSNPDILRRLASEFAQQQKVSAFTTNFLPVNQGQAPEIWTILDFDTMWSRFVSAWYFLTLGWYVFTLAALIAFFKGVLLLRGGCSRVVFACVLALLIFSALFVARPFWAHTQLDRAYLAEARGDTNEAIALYRATMRLDPWYASGPELYAQIGELHEALGVLDSPEYRLYKGQVFENQGVQPMAIFEYRLAARGGGDLETVAHREAARVAANFGLTLYPQQAFGAALALWQQAFEEDPFQIQALFYAARAHFDVGQYQEAIAAGEQFCKRASNPYRLADVYSDMGDSYTKLGDHSRARAYYELSFKLDYIVNARGLGALTGN
jgi:tetratricopeptide (TPR) repeat protein